MVSERNWLTSADGSCRALTWSRAIDRLSTLMSSHLIRGSTYQQNVYELLPNRFAGHRSKRYQTRAGLPGCILTWPSPPRHTQDDIRCISWCPAVTLNLAILSAVRYFSKAARAIPACGINHSSNNEQVCHALPVESRLCLLPAPSSSTFGTARRLERQVAKTFSHIRNLEDLARRQY